MKLSGVVAHVVSIIEAVPTLSGIEVLSSLSADHNRQLESSLREKGFAIVVMQTGGEAVSDKGPQLYLRNSVLVSVLENPVTNQTGLRCLDAVEAVLEAVHQSNWPQQRGLKNVLTVDKPAYEAGPLDGGLVTYFCNFTFTTFQ